MNQSLRPSDSDGERIEPLSFRSGSRYRTFGDKAIFRWMARTLAALILCLLGVGAWFVFTAKQVTIQIDPEPDTLTLQGGIAHPRMGAYYLMRSGEYVLTAQKACYRDLSHGFQIGPAKTQQIQLEMKRLPGKLAVNGHPVDNPEQALNNATVFLDGKEIGRTPIPALEVDAGVHLIEISADKYKTVKRQIPVEGCGKLQSVDLALIPGWSNLMISSRPAGATVLINGKALGKTPAQLDLPEGSYMLALKATGHKPWQHKIDIVANQPLNLGEIKLRPADGKLTVTTTPSGAKIAVGKRTAGKTPITMSLTPDKQHTVSVSKQGFDTATRVVRLKSAESKRLEIALAPRIGIIRLDVTPQDAGLWIDGVQTKTPAGHLELTAVEHELEIKKKGYQTYRKRILPRPGKPLDLRIVLKSIDKSPSSDRKNIKAPNGYTLTRVAPSAFKIGSSRREQGRRSNEALRSIELRRPFYMGLKEVTNREFRQFQAAHRSGRYNGQPLDDDRLPVVQVSWEQAALFCNWLSASESLPPVYIKKNGRLTAADPIGAGYRLPTEAEWAFVARSIKGSQPTGMKFPWGSGFPPPVGSGNFADQSAKNVLTAYLENYNDGYAVSAPPGKFKANQLGFYDLGGNVAEWCHDYYYIYGSGKKFVDPTGPAEGRHHLVRGSSWKHGNLSELRLAYRDYSDGKRPDLGFRVSRYAK